MIAIYPAGAVTQTSVEVTASFSDEYTLVTGTLKVFQDGVEKTSQFTFSWASPGCGAPCGALLRGTINVPTSGTTTITATGCDEATNCGSASEVLSYQSPKKVVVAVAGSSPLYPPSYTRSSASFTVSNQTSATATYQLAAICGGQVTGCSPSVTSLTLYGNTSQTVTAAFDGGAPSTSGSVKLRAVHSSDATIRDSATVSTYTIGSWPVAATFDFNNNDSRRAGLCASNCFAASHIQATVPYISGGVPQSVTLTYSGDNVANRPFVYANIDIAAGATRVPTTVTLRARVNGVERTFLNGAAPSYFGEQVLTFDGSAMVAGRRYRLAGQIDATDLATGTYPLQLVVVATYGSSSQTSQDSLAQFTHDSRLIVVNDVTGTIARGWRIAGVERLYRDAGGILLVDDGSALYFRQNPTDANDFLPPADEFTTLRYDPTAQRYVRASDDSTRRYFSSLGLLDSIVDRLGLTRRFGYDGTTGQLVRITDPVRRETIYSGGFWQTIPARITLRYDAATGRLTEIVEPGDSGSLASARVTRVQIGSTGLLTAITDPDNMATRFTYDAKQRLDTVIDRNGGRWRNVYDERSWKLSRIDYPTIAVDSAGVGTSIATPRVTLMAWQLRGVPVAATAGAGIAPPRPLLADSVFATVVGIARDTTRYTVDRWGQPLVTTAPPGQVTTITRTGRFVSAVTDERGRTSNLWWERGRLMKSIPYKGSTSETVYGKFGVPTSRKVNGAEIYKYTYDARGRLLTEAYNISQITYHYPDAFGRDTLVKDAQLHVTRVAYDARTGNAKSVSTSKGRTTALFDRQGRDSVVTVAGSGSVRTIYDLLNRPVRVFTAAADSATRYEYDGLHLRSVVDAKGRQYRRDVNALGWPTLEYDPQAPTDTSKALRFYYGSDGSARRVVNRRRQSIRLEYDSITSQLQRRSALAGTTVAAPQEDFSISADGRLAVARNQWSVDSAITGRDGADTVFTKLGGATFMTVHTAAAGAMAEGRRVVDTTLIVASGPGVNASTFQFRPRRVFLNEGNWRVDSVAFGSAVVRIARNDELLPDTVKAEVPGYAFDPRAFTYTAEHQVATASFVPGGTAMDVTLGRGYAYDSAGRVTEERFVDGSLPMMRAFGYDGGSRLRTVKLYEQGTDSSCTPNQDEPSGCSWSYFPAWQPSSVQGQTKTFMHDEVANLTRERDDVTSILDTAVFASINRLQNWKSAEYTYDADGNRVLKARAAGNVSYAWNAYGQLTEVRAGPDTSLYAYNALGRLVRIEKRRSGYRLSVRFLLWDRESVIAEIDSSSSGLRKLSEYMTGGPDSPIAMETMAGDGAAMVTLFAMDATGSVLGTYSADELRAYRFDSWGVPSAWTQLVGRPGWKGMFWEGDSTRMYYARNRWYDPEARRFASEDPIGIDGGINMYAFTGGDPVNYRDPSGLCGEGGYHEGHGEYRYSHYHYYTAEWVAKYCGTGGGSASWDYWQNFDNGSGHLDVGSSMLYSAMREGVSTAGHPDTKLTQREPIACPAQLTHDVAFSDNLHGSLLFEGVVLNRIQNNAFGVATYETLTDPIDDTGTWRWLDGGLFLKCSIVTFYRVPGLRGQLRMYDVLDAWGPIVPGSRPR